MNDLHLTLQAEQTLGATLQAGGATTAALQTGGVADIALVALKLAEKRRIGLAGGAAGSALFDGSEDVTVNASVQTLSNEELEEMLR